MSVVEVSTTINFEFIDDNFEDHRILVLPGGTRCFVMDQLVITSKGSKPMREIQVGDKVLSYNEQTNRREFKAVERLHNYPSPEKKLIKIHLNNGETITGTEDHEIYYKGGWISLKHFVTLLDERDMERDT